MATPYNMFSTPAYNPPVYQNQRYSQPANNQQNMTWVNGEEGAWNHLMTPNSTMALWDSENQVIYLKTTDISGRASMRYIDYTVRENTSDENTKDVVTKEEFEKFAKDITDQIKQLAPQSKKNRNFEED